MRGKIIAVAGPTASGKTALAVFLAKKTDGEVVSCDSMQIYKHMNIGTAKPDKAEMQGIPHHMIDIIEPWENYSVAAFARDARNIIDDILSRGKTPIIAGGTGLYMDSVLFNTDFPDFGSDEEYRRGLVKLSEEKGADALHDILKEKDPEAAEKIHPNNIRRVIRAIEVCHLSGRTFTQVNAESRREAIYEPLIFGLDAERSVLYDRINRRVDRMMDMGLLDEARRIYDMKLDKSCTATQAIGYKELFEFFEGKAEKEEAIEKIKQESRRYAKRQLTWLRRNPDIIWLMLQDCYSLDKIYEQCFTFIKRFGIII